MIISYIRMARASLAAAKWRSFLTMLGVIVCVVSVVTVVGLGEGVKRQLVAQVDTAGANLITVRGGDVTTVGSQGSPSPSDLAMVFSRIPLGAEDFNTIVQTEGVNYAVPFALMGGDLRLADGSVIDDVTVVATNEHAAQALGQDVVSGNFFSESDSNAATAVIGRHVAERLFRQNVPIGQNFTLKERKITVSGVFDTFDINPLAPGLDYNNVIFIPYGLGSEMAGAAPLPFQVLVRPTDDVSVQQLAGTLDQALSENHSGQRDFSVLTAEDTIALAGSMVRLLTTLVGVIALVALLVGGIGIMNVMLASVSERTQEIGVRKSVGATNRQILGQFLAESVMLSFVGAVIGTVCAILVNYTIQVTTELRPVIDWRVVAGTALVAVIVGSFFGLAPAYKASRKDPIQALRRL